MKSSKLSDQWISKEAWHRALFVRCGLIWLFREEFTDLNPGPLNSLGQILVESYRIGNAEAAQPSTVEAAFGRTVELVKSEIDRRISSIGDDAELGRLKKLVEEARCCDPLQQTFDVLARNTRGIYREHKCRKVVLEREWLIDHPYGQSRPGDYRDAYHANAQTRISGDTAYVELQVHLDHFDGPSLMAVPALLTHELVCHAQAQEDRNDDHSLWAEGVMDWVSVHFFNIWAPHLCLPYGLTKIHGMQLWDDRMTPSREIGRLAADTLVQWWTEDQSVRRTSVALGLTANLALQVNATDAPLRAKDVLASRLANIQRDAPLQEAVRAWRRDREPVASLLG